MQSFTRKIWLIVTMLCIVFPSGASSFIPGPNIVLNHADEDAGFPEFITTWVTDDTEITIPTFGGESYLYNLTWTNLTNTGVGDGSKSNLTGDYTISGLANNDIYEIKISGAFPRIYFNNGGDKDKILTIENWGDQAWTSMASAFYGCSNLTVTASDAPDLTNVIDMSSMFRRASSLNSDFTTWDVGTIENMSRLFQDATLFNGDITTWDVSQVKNMSDMFFFAENFNQDIGGWLTDNVTDMSGMFGVAKAFNQDINLWNVSNVTSMNQMFSVAESFNQPLKNWNVTNVTDFGGMFNGATVFNQNISTWTINPTLPVKMGAMFSNAIAFNQDIGGWNVSMVTDMGSMFAGATAFDQVLSNWQVGNVTTMRLMFSGTTYNQDIIGWDVSNVSDFNGMFSGNPAFNQNISGWITSSAGDFRNMFSSATAFNQNLGNWDISNIYSNDMYKMLNNSGLTIENYDATLMGWASQSHNINVQLGASGLYYCAAESAHATLIGDGWLIYDEGQGCIAVYEGTGTSGPQITNGQVAPMDFGSTGQGTDKLRQITIENRLATPITINNPINITGSTYSITSPALPVIILAGGTQGVDISMSGAVTGGPFDETLTISTNVPSTFTFPITGKVTATDEPEIKVFEGTGVLGTEIIDGDLSGIFIGEENRGTDATYQITILNNGSASLDVSDITFTGSAFSATPNTFPITIPVDGSQTIDITLSGSAAGIFTETMNIVNTDSDEDPFDFVVTGTIYGPELVVVNGTNFYSDPPINNGQATPLDIGTSTQGSDITYQISLTNDGPVDLTVTDLSISGTSFSHNASLPLSVPAVVDGVYSYEMFNITLDGTTAGTFTETVTITSDDDTDPIYVFDVTGDIIDPNAPKAYWSDANEINRSNLDGSGFEQYHMESTYSPRGVAIDTANNIIYWTNNWGQIRKGTIDVAGFSSVSDFINDGIDLSRELNGVALDLTARTIYWVSTYDGAIKSADLDAGSPISTVQTIVSGLLHPIGIAVDPAGKIYYTENDNNGGNSDNTATLHQVNFDGSNDVVLSTRTTAGQQYTYRDIKLDVGNNTIYWSGGNDDIYTSDGHIYYANLSDVSGTVTSYNTFNNSPWGIDLDLINNKVYWIDILTYMVEPKIARADLDGSNLEILHDGFNAGLNAPLFIALSVNQLASCANPPTANAGADQTICETGVANLSGTIGGGAATLAWSTNGDGAFDDTTSLTAIYTPGATDITNGTVTLTLTTDDPDGTGPCTSAADEVILTFEALPTSNAGVDQTVCESDVVALSGSIGGSATSGTWTTSGDGTFDDNTSLAAIYTPGTTDLTSGTVTLTLTTSGSTTCSSVTDDVVITFDQTPTVDAGVDQIICPSDVVNLNAIIGGSVTGGSWSTTGDGSFDDTSSLNAIYTPGSTDVSNGSITLTLASISANCPVVTDDVIISFNQPITAINQTGGTLKVNETIVVNALNGATINAGDVITTSVTVDPQKGIVTVNADGTIDYTASEGNVGSDSFDFQICNQCNLCSTATANVTIENDAPDFSGTTTSASPGAPVTVDIISLITDVNNNIDLSSIRIVEQPISGAVATLDGDNNLIVDYTGVIFFGTDEVVIEVCDFDGACTTAIIQIEVEAQPIVAFNAVSPNGDGRHDFLEFEFIEAYPNNEVKIFNRWGDVVFEMEGYNNQNKVFDGKANKGASKDLPTGTYYYTVFYQTVDNQNKTVKGFLELRR